MATNVTLIRGDVIEEALAHLYRPSTRPGRVIMGSTALTTTSDTDFTLSSGELGVPSVVEFDTELVFVYAKSDDATPVYTCARAHGGSTAAAHATGDVGLISPTWPRHEVTRWVDRFVSRAANKHLPNIESDTYYRETDLRYVEMPANTVRMFSVRYMHPTTGAIIDMAGWKFYEDLPTDVVSTGKAIRLPRIVGNSDELIVTYQTPYAWSDDPATEDSTLSVPLGAEDLPALYAAAFGLVRRELSRTQVDEVEDWSEDLAQRQGITVRLVRELWGEFYRVVDEVKDLQNVPVHRPYEKMARLGSGR